MKCTRCGSTEDLILQGRRIRKNGDIYTYYNCSRCSIEKQRKFRQTESGHQSVIKSTQKYRDNNRDRMNAWRVGGRVKVADSCEVCGKSGVQRHHPDYSKPAYVIPLCPLHHKAAHKKIGVEHAL
jgi:hypothetical protein